MPVVKASLTLLYHSFITTCVIGGKCNTFICNYCQYISVEFCRYDSSATLSYWPIYISMPILGQALLLNTMQATNFGNS